MQLRPSRLLAACLLVLCAACATTSRRALPGRNVLTREEMLQARFITVYDAVSALRSNWLIVRPNTLTTTQEDVVVYYDVTRLGSPVELRNIAVRDIQYVQYLDPVEATQRYGVGHSQGVIFVSSHSP